MKTNIEEKIIVVALIMCMSLIVAYVSIALTRDLTNSKTFVIKVESKEIQSGRKTTKKLLFTKNEVFSVNDNVFKWNFDSMDRYNMLKSNKCYEVKANGFRLNFPTMYRNILEAKEVTCQH